MGAKRYIISLSLLFVLMLGVGNHILALSYLCHSSIHAGLEEQHHCCRCCCDSDEVRFEHRCVDVEFELSEYIISNINRGNGDDSFDCISYLNNNNSYLENSERAMLALFEVQQRWLYALFDESQYRGYTPSSGGLRAPPVLG